MAPRTLIIVDGQRPFFADPDTIKTEHRTREGRTYDVVSAAGRWSPDGDHEWMSWIADRAEIRRTTADDLSERPR